MIRTFDVLVGKRAKDVDERLLRQRLAPIEPELRLLEAASDGSVQHFRQEAATRRVDGVIL
jgi:hypothetical protein